MAQDLSNKQTPEQIQKAFREDIFVRIGLDGNVVFSFSNISWANTFYKMVKKPIGLVTVRNERGKNFYDVRMPPKEYDKSFRDKEITLVAGNILTGTKSQGFKSSIHTSQKLTDRRRNAMAIMFAVEGVYRQSNLHRSPDTRMLSFTGLFEKDENNSNLFDKNPELLLDIIKNYAPDNASIVTCRRLLDLMLSEGNIDINHYYKIKKLLEIDTLEKPLEVDEKIKEILATTYDKNNFIADQLAAASSSSANQPQPQSQPAANVFSNIGKGVLGFRKNIARGVGGIFEAPSSSSSTATTTTSTSSAISTSSVASTPRVVAATTTASSNVPTPPPINSLNIGPTVKTQSQIENEITAERLNISNHLLSGLEGALKKECAGDWALIRQDVVMLFGDAEDNTANANASLKSFQAKLANLLTIHKDKFKQDDETQGTINRLQARFFVDYSNRNDKNKQVNKFAIKKDANNDAVIAELKTKGTARLKETNSPYKAPVSASSSTVTTTTVTSAPAPTDLPPARPDFAISASIPVVVKEEKPMEVIKKLEKISDLLVSASFQNKNTPEDTFAIKGCLKAVGNIMNEIAAHYNVEIIQESDDREKGESLINGITTHEFLKAQLNESEAVIRALPQNSSSAKSVVEKLLSKLEEARKQALPNENTAQISENIPSSAASSDTSAILERLARSQAVLHWFRHTMPTLRANTRLIAPEFTTMAVFDDEKFFPLAKEQLEKIFASYNFSAENVSPAVSSSQCIDLITKNYPQQTQLSAHQLLVDILKDTFESLSKLPKNSDEQRQLVREAIISLSGFHLGNMGSSAASADNKYSAWNEAMGKPKAAPVSMGASRFNIHNEQNNRTPVEEAEYLEWMGRFVGPNTKNS
jgi:hypothetical protein